MENEKSETAYFGGGCFWGVEASFKTAPGVLKTAVGYMGGQKQDPTYKEVCSDTTGHAEVVQVVYDPAKISFEKLVEFFWQLHDPTTINRQGPDVGSQYRSAIFYTSDFQHAAAEKSAGTAQRSFKQPIVTQIAQAGPFYAAENYHQDYFKKNPYAQCHYLKYSHAKLS